jgi:hypothetical protein
MTTEKLSVIEASAKSIRSQLRMAYFMLLLFAIHLVEAYITFPFVDHTTVGQNVVYGLIVGAPCYITIIIFILIRRKDLAAAK